MTVYFYYQDKEIAITYGDPAPQSMDTVTIDDVIYVVATIDMKYKADKDTFGTATHYLSRVRVDLTKSVDF